ncbi:MAG: hypothetical protein ACK559_24710, partial [bacterium]
LNTHPRRLKPHHLVFTFSGPAPRPNLPNQSFSLPLTRDLPRLQPESFASQLPLRPCPSLTCLLFTLRFQICLPNELGNGSTAAVSPPIVLLVVSFRAPQRLLAAERTAGA